ncbi:signal peptidase II . Aspartic peptidase. MEROPS family A08 [Parasphingorhabdus marina DSM 22363]|uniref:Lipoprotein signal peptidase n=1 Tax=Parasphingorhabdus marina DSM 22363 TaxID=1123272 RepID=A0A1N6CSI9_9SPHN|nr:signal peptidase II [Parasphingorhabdus marina]SIN61445.1 signal peptidase II . Aspartic peptidase. MEROPS family A08 [Parasphingorhabdus marina DSM 22363]
MTDDKAVRRYRMTGLIIAFLIFAADQFTKYMVMHPLDLKAKGQIVLLPFFNLTWAENYGVSMGFLTASTDFQRWALVALTGLIGFAVLIWMWREQAKWDIFALSLVLGGAMGNILDRARLGYVADFADLHINGFRPFLIFNVADACISIGVVILLGRALLLRDRTPEAND